MNIRLLTLFLPVLFASCKKDQDLVSGKEKLSRITFSYPSIQASNTLNFKYDLSGKLVEVLSVGTGGEISQKFSFDGSGVPISSKVSKVGVGDQYGYEFEVDAMGRVISAKGISYVSDLFVEDHKFIYDAKGRIIIDSAFSKSGTWQSYVSYEYDSRDNVVGYQQFFNHGSSTYTDGRWMVEYDSKRGPYSEV